MGVVVHIVLFKAKADAKPADIALMVSSIKALKKAVPNVIDLSIGAQDSKIYQNYKERCHGFTHILVVKFPTSEALQEYALHPEHQRVVREHVLPNTSDILAVDYTDRESAKCPGIFKWGGIVAGLVAAGAIGFALGRK
eukprot:Opistho-2@28499